MPESSVLHEVGSSRNGLPIRACILGQGPQKISLLGGCHADEPIGPLLLQHLTTFLSSLPKDHPFMAGRQWWILPHANPDAEGVNQVWWNQAEETINFASYLKGVVREGPGDDIEFGFPSDPKTHSFARPENKAIAAWWNTCPLAFSLHVSLHGMAFAGGAWFLLDEKWIDRTLDLRGKLVTTVKERGYALHDVERKGEKGFTRIEPGFCTCPNSRAMSEHFTALGDEQTARKFLPSSMEWMRGHSGDPLTMVTELPLFILEGVGTTIGPPDPVQKLWDKNISTWKKQLSEGVTLETINKEAYLSGLIPMPIRTQMYFQLAAISLAMEAVGVA